MSGHDPSNGVEQGGFSPTQQSPLGTQAPAAGDSTASRSVTTVGPADLALVITEWEQLGREEPWHLDPHRYGVDSLHETIRAVLDIARWGSTGTFAAERLVRTAAAHGEQRRAQGATDDALLREYHALRAALWRFLQHSLVGPPLIATILRVDVAIGVATTVAVRGFHRAEAVTGRSWEADMLAQVDAVSRHLVDHLQANGRS